MGIELRGLLSLAKELRNGKKLPTLRLPVEGEDRVVIDESLKSPLQLTRQGVSPSPIDEILKVFGDLLLPPSLCRTAVSTFCLGSWTSQKV